MVQSNMEQEEVEVRERRLHSVISFHGTAAELNEKSRQLCLKSSCRLYQQCSTCSQSCAETVTYLIRDAAVVVHAPIGCCSNASSNDIEGNVANRQRGLPRQPANIICTNITEKDTIYGAVDKLRKAVHEAYKRFRPSAIFVHSSCAAGIIGENIESEADLLQKKLGIPIVPVYCEGFKSKIWTTGFDAAYHGILRKIVKPPRYRQKDLVNVFNFMGDDTFSALLQKLGLRANYLVPLANIQTISRMSEAACSAHICETLATYVASELEKQYGVPEVKAPAPFGIKWTDQWLRTIAGYTHKEGLVEQVIQSEHERIRPALEKIRAKLKGIRVYVFAGDSYTHSLANMAADLGLEITGLTSLHHDQKTDNDSEDLNSLNHLIQSRGNIQNYSICNKQPYQAMKIIERSHPDLMIVRHTNMTIMGTKLGIPSVMEGDVNASAGYDGLLKLGRRLDAALQRKKILQNIAAHVKLPYTDWWMKQDDPFYFERGK